MKTVLEDSIANNTPAEKPAERDATEFKHEMYAKIRKTEQAGKWAGSVFAVMAIAGAFLLMI
jgi:hypothetical protein